MMRIMLWLYVGIAMRLYMGARERRDNIFIIMNNIHYKAMGNVELIKIWGA